MSLILLKSKEKANNGQPLIYTYMENIERIRKKFSEMFA